MDDYSKYRFSGIGWFFKGYEKILNDIPKQEKDFQELCNRLPFWLVEYFQYMLVLGNYKGVFVWDNTFSDVWICEDVCRNGHLLLYLINEIRKISCT